jgi:hypothetical protein
MLLTAFPNLNKTKCLYNPHKAKIEMKRNMPTIGAKLYRKFATVAGNKSFVLCDPISWPARN